MTTAKHLPGELGLSPAGQPYALLQVALMPCCEAPRAHGTQAMHALSQLLFFLLRLHTLLQLAVLAAHAWQHLVALEPEHCQDQS